MCSSRAEPERFSEIAPDFKVSGEPIHVVRESEDAFSFLCTELAHSVLQKYRYNVYRVLCNVRNSRERDSYTTREICKSLAYPYWVVLIPYNAIFDAVPHQVTLIW